MTRAECASAWAEAHAEGAATGTCPPLSPAALAGMMLDATCGSATEALLLVADGPGVWRETRELLAFFASEK